MQQVEQDTRVNGIYGIGRRNERGERLVEFCKENSLIIGYVSYVVVVVLRLHNRERPYVTARLWHPQTGQIVSYRGVLLDTELSMKQHITRIASNCFCHLRRLRQIRRVVGKDVTSHLISAFLLS